MSEGETRASASSYQPSLLPRPPVKGTAERGKQHSNTLQGHRRVVWSPPRINYLSVGQTASDRCCWNRWGNLVVTNLTWGTCSSKNWAPSDFSAAAADLQKNKSPDPSGHNFTNPFVRWKSCQSAGGGEAALLSAMKSSETITHLKTFFFK